ncbi:putative small secreted protein [Labrenzia sp. MBR-25]|jgi:predicted small secreted protein
MRKALVLIAVLLAGCQTTQGYWYSQKTGQRVDESSALLAQFQKDRAICDGEAAKAALTSTAKTNFEHKALVNLVFDGCLTDRGYIRKTG